MIVMGRITLAAAALIAALSPAGAQTRHDGHGAEPAIQGAYVPRLGDLMILQQIRHAKLWFAVAANNWDLADHELDGIKAAFADLAKLYPVVYGVSVAPAIEALIGREIPDIGKTIEAQDRVAFTVTYDRLTAACNACHHATKHAFIVIQQPISPPLNNQSYGPVQGGPGGDPSHRH
jgi:hypothetical protein